MSNSWDEKAEAIKSLKKGSGIKNTINEISRILGNPIVMFDTSYNILSYTEMTVTDDFLWNELIDSGAFSDETVKFFNNENFIKSFDKSDVTVLLKSDKLKYDRINGKLFDKDNVQIANLLVLGCYKPFEEGDEEMIELACDIVSVELRSSELYHRLGRAYHESLVSKMIDGDVKDIKNLALLELYKNLKANIYVVAVDVAECENTLTHLKYYRDLFGKIQPEYKYYIHLNNIFILLSTDEAIFEPKAGMKKLDEYFLENKIYAGISSRFQDLKELQKYYREAVNALNYGIKSKNKHKHNIFCYEDFRLEHFLQAVCHSVDISEIYNPTFFLIKEYDKEHNSTLINTLYYYLYYGLNKELACEEVGITIEELTKQLHLLERQFNIDWNNGDMLYSLFITMKSINNIE